MTISVKTLLISIAIIGLLMWGGYNYYTTRIRDLKSTIDTQVKLKNALVDTLKIYVNSNKEIVAEKLTLQARVGELMKKNNKLSNKQLELLLRVKKTEKKSKIIAAALVEANVRLDSFINVTKPIINTDKSSITFADSTRFFKYNIGVFKVIPLSATISPTLSINNLELYNKQFIQFYWKDERKNGYPVSFSISNSNPYVKVSDINSYIIPEINKNELKPGFFRSVGVFYKNNKDIILVPVAVGLGFLINSFVK